MSYEVVLTKAALKDLPKLKAAHLNHKTKHLIDVLAENPWQNPPPYEKLMGDLKGTGSRRINIQHRLLYEVDDQSRIVKILRMWTHYE